MDGQSSLVDKSLKGCMNKQKALVLWLTGLSASGKTTTGDIVTEKRLSLGYSAFHLDGDDLRSCLNKVLGFELADRTENIRGASEVAKLMVDTGLIDIFSDSFFYIFFINILKVEGKYV